jgi:hypothetical protein
MLLFERKMCLYVVTFEAIERVSREYAIGQPDIMHF